MQDVKLISLKNVSNNDNYNAFTDLAYFNGQYWLAYRSGTGHVSPEGKIIIKNSEDADTWEQVTIISREKIDCRDPRLYAIDGQLILVFFTLDYYNTNGAKFVPGNSYFYVLNDSNEFEEAGCFDIDKRTPILWNLAKIENKFYTIGYKFIYGHSEATLYSSTSLSGPWEKISKITDDGLPPNAGFNEIDIMVEDDNSMTLFCRVDENSSRRIEGGKQAKKIAKRMLKERKKSRNVKTRRGFQPWFAVAHAEPPYTNWNTKYYNDYYKGPRAIRDINSNDSEYYFVARHMNKGDKKRSIRLFYFDKEQKFTQLLTLAVGKDGSYAGLCWNPNDNKELIISIYSDHERRFAKPRIQGNDIWIAKIRVE